MFNLRTWRPRHLLASWCVYWVGLIAVTMSKALVAISHATGAGDGQGSVAVSFNNASLSLTATLAGKTLWTGTASLLTIALALAGPPLVLWLMWVFSRDREPPRDPALLNDASDVGDSQRARERERARTSQ